MGINLKFPLRSYRKGFFEMNNTTLDAIREDIKILLLTKKGERVVNPSIGTNIPILMGELFEPIKEQEMSSRIGAEIRTALEAWMPYVRLDNIEIFSQDTVPGGTSLNPNDILVVMKYSVLYMGGISDSIQLNFETAGTK